MTVALRALSADLEIRADRVLSLLDGLEAPQDRVEDVKTVAAYVRGEAAALRASTTEDVDTLLLDYDLANEKLVLREHIELPFLTKWDAASERATRLCDELCKAIGWPWPSPIVGTFSTSGHWTYAELAVVALPAGEEQRLLSLPDLVHELAHTAIDKESGELIDDLYVPIADAMRAVDDALIPTGIHRNDFVDELILSWEAGWLEETICDLVATFCMGPAFAWQHLRLWAQSTPITRSCPELVRLESQHPPDAARMRAVRCLIDYLGCADPGSPCESEWQTLIASTLDPSSHDLFEAVFGTNLMAEIAAHVVEACDGLDLVRFELRDDDHLPTLVHHAWDKAVTDPEGFLAFEDEAIRRLWAKWGV